MATAAAPKSAAPGPKLRFCPESNDLLYPEEDRERKVRLLVYRFLRQSNTKKKNDFFLFLPSNCFFFSFFFRFPVSLNLLFYALSLPLFFSLSHSSPGPHPPLQKLRLRRGRPSQRVVRPPLRDPPLGARADRRAARRPGRPDAAVHARRAVPELPAQRGRVLLGAVGGRDDAVLQLHEMRAQVEGLCVKKILKKNRMKKEKEKNVFFIVFFFRCVLIFCFLHRKKSFLKKKSARIAPSPKKN